VNVSCSSGIPARANNYTSQHKVCGSKELEHIFTVLTSVLSHCTMQIALYAKYNINFESRDSSVGIALGYGLDDRGSRVRFPAGAGNFSVTTTSRTVLGSTRPPIQWVRGFLSLGVKRPEREADHSPPCSAEVKECMELYLHSPNMPSWRGA
jgi:hypothetical protein